MTMNLFQTHEYRTLMQEHLSETIDYLFKKNQEFALACEIKYITFSPELPSSIKDSFDHTVLFILSGFTLETAQLEEEYFSFEAGFGSDNFGSVVSVPLLAIKQIFVGENPIVINFADPLIKDREKREESASKKSSMEALLNNPENKKLLKNKK
ncbi:hypothetical protein [Sulfurovum sp.]|uniref:hypothetical protein n=1 Tax=Sulfurovum sp. TaxID=1969726 RepID=UPI002867CCE2|nr:hypothetical protein [Sulfurovum sp.]